MYYLALDNESEGFVKSALGTRPNLSKFRLSLYLPSRNLSMIWLHKSKKVVVMRCDRCMWRERVREQKKEGIGTRSVIEMLPLIKKKMVAVPQLINIKRYLFLGTRCPIQITLSVHLSVFMCIFGKIENNSNSNSYLNHTFVFHIIQCDYIYQLTVISIYLSKISPYYFHRHTVC